jgi:hypothetical protein
MSAEDIFKLGLLFFGMAGVTALLFGVMACVATCRF